jgi:hypothetical protein
LAVAYIDQEADHVQNDRPLISAALDAQQAKKLTNK